jgi:hypothetical protein
MLTRFITISCLAALATALLLSPGAAVGWPSSEMYSYGPPGTPTLTVAPSYSIAGEYYIYYYDLTNNTSNMMVDSFDLTLPAAVPVDSALSDFGGPDGWISLTRHSESINIIDWLNDTGESVMPGETARFSFKTKSAPSATMVVTADCHDSWGWTGDTYGPIPEPSSIVALMFGIVGLAGFRRTRR